MARENHPRIKQARALARKKGQRPPYDRVLIVCEGKKTEPFYFEAIRRKYRISPMHISVHHGGVTQPKQIVDYAERTFLKARAYDQVYVVFDRDDHPTYHDALQKAATLDGKLKNDERKLVRFIAIPSVPCFELWLLLHFQDVHAFGTRDEITQKLKLHISDYEKGAENIYERTEHLTRDALKRAKHLKSMYVAASGTDPYTDIDSLVELLHSLKAVPS
jgi:hypothetical protein